MPVYEIMITPRHPALDSALRAERGWRNQILLAGKYGRNFFMEREILICDLKSLAAECAIALHHSSIVRRP